MLKFKKKFVLSGFGIFTIFCLMIMMLIINTHAGTTMGGSGTISDPYIITTASQLESISSGGLDKCYKLGNNLDISSYTIWKPIGNTLLSAFVGTFDGNGYKITGLTVNSSSSTGLGLFGYTNGATIKNVGIDVSIYSNSDDIGGLVGCASSTTIVNCYAIGKVSGARYVGGLVGDSEYSTITNCYSADIVSFTDDYAGGFIGYNNSSTITNCYSISKVISGSNTYNSAGGFIGKILFGKISKCYWCYSNNTTMKIGIGSDTTKTSNLIGMALTGMQSQTFKNILNANISKLSLPTSKTWNYLSGINNSLPYISCFNINDLKVTAFTDSDSQPTGNGTSADPYIITTVDELSSIQQLGFDKCYKLGNDIVVSGNTSWVSIGTSDYPFTGTFDGNGYKITGLTINASLNSNNTSCLGLFGYTNKAILKNINIDISMNETTSSSGSNYGGLVGYSYETNLNNCSVKGSITSGGNYIGGLIGYSSFSTLSYCVATADVTGNGSYVGGLVGYDLSSTISNSYASGNVTSDNDYIGGFIGYDKHGTISNCYEIGNVEGKGYNFGGLIGYDLSSKISNSYATGDITSNNNYVGGLIGCDVSGTFINCYESGSVAGKIYVGGFIGSTTSGTITNCYITGDISGSQYVGGIMGVAIGTTVINCYESGKLVSVDKTFSGGIVGNLTQKSKVKNCYWNSDSCNNGYGNNDCIIAIEVSTFSATGMDLDKMQTSAFAIILSNNRISTYSQKKWIYSFSENNGLPYLKGIGVVDTTPPIGKCVLSAKEITNKSVIITVTATDAGSGVASITTPDGTVINEGYTSTYKVSKNGTYKFILMDNSNNLYTYSVVVSNIDKTSPTAKISYNITKTTNKNVVITVSASDNNIVSTIKLPNGTIVKKTRTTYTASKNGIYIFVITDKAGNKTTVNAIVKNIKR